MADIGRWVKHLFWLTNLVIEEKERSENDVKDELSWILNVILFDTCMLNQGTTGEMFCTNAIKVYTLNKPKLWKTCLYCTCNLELVQLLKILCFFCSSSAPWLKRVNIPEPLSFYCWKSCLRQTYNEFTRISRPWCWCLKLHQWIQIIIQC